MAASTVSGSQKIDEHPLWQGIAQDARFYFVHSYHFRCQEQYVLGRTPYCGGFASAIGCGKRFGVQFHPEKSHKFGMKLYKNFVEYA